MINVDYDQAMSDMTAAEVADRLGVKLDTVYAYVSRGVLGVRRESAPRRSLFDSAEVDVLARRGRPRRSSRPAALDLVVETGLTTIVDQRLRYRGRDAVELADAHSFEDVAEWLWTGTDRAFGGSWEAYPVEVPPSVGEARDRIRLAVVLGSALECRRDELDPANVVRIARRLLATIVRALAPGVPADGASIAAGLTAELGGRRRTRPLVTAVDAALVLLADHELASSTVTARVAASVRADPFSVVLAGLGSIAGPLHGSASGLVHRMVEDAVVVGPARSIASATDVGGSVPGFEHRLYPEGDPRAAALLDLVEAAVPRAPALVAAHDLRAVVWQQSRRLPNVDFALGVLSAAAGWPATAGETIFTVARTAGWIAHALEEYGEPPVRFRARAVARSTPPPGP